MKGFTLIELMIVVCIIGILTAIIYPNYLKHAKQAQIKAQTKQDTIAEQEDKRPDNSIDPVTYQCIDGIVYLFVTKNDKNYMAPKEDTFGYNVKCSL